MNRLLILTIIAGMFFIASCNTHNEKDKAAEKSAKKISKRNYYINKTNAFNDFFFDSVALVNYINDRKLPDSISRRMVSFYNSRNYQFAWFSSTGISEQARGFWNMYKYYSSYEPEKVVKDATFSKSMDNLIANTDSAWEGRQVKLIASELRLTEYYLLYFLSNIDKGYLKRKEIEKFIPAEKKDPIHIADSLVHKKHKDDKYYGDVNKAYGALQEYLSKYIAIYKQGGWPVIHEKASMLRTGSNTPGIATLKKRLYQSEDLLQPDSTVTWTDELTEAIKKFQLRHGYKTTGTLTDMQLKDMNVPVKKRIEQILINMGRTQWIIDQPKGRFILVNIPEFLLHATENGKKIFDMPVVVGMEGHNTTIFTGKLNQVVFAPYWNVPESIVEKEIAPAMEKDQDYLSKHEMEVVGTLRKGLPAIRQLPGPKNSLGLVKFLFPNSFDIYFHDTPAKSLFAKEKRAFSHGCIRLSQPAKMAEWLLEEDPKWNAALITKAMHEPEEKSVSLKNPVPVLITYYTTWVSEDGLLRFADDVYDHDNMQRKKMFN